ncbi:amino acid ABC transporter ATP-binding protein [Atopobium sp. oral taxon 810]|uniref:amino acid ABC transporter ATP-binding protein n=1 Tax=Atopobium sp. oral taxon 810 TaxID=712158 RepID=UPI000397B966|nr:amino acid ABC transporter ATP-binding protein [Atopobium sp. oral taxon 810]ERI05649.1 ABC transporter, ATP-binding protein [Atopobium sp. oral taxon 810 str. F0209]
MLKKKPQRKLPTPDISYSSLVGLPAVYLRGARKSFGENEVLHDISLTINRGEVLSIIGPSGAGKSTLLRCLTLLDSFDSGELSYDSIVVCKPRGSELDSRAKKDPNPETGEHTLDIQPAIYDRAAMQRARMRFGIVFQDYNLFPHMTVLQNVMDAPLVVQKRNPAEVEEQARKLLERLDLTEHADKVPCQLSGGQQQRVAIARALCMKPRVIFFDEATSALDPRLTDDMVKLIRSLAEEGMAVGLVTHEMGFARAASDRVCLLLDGRIVEEGTPEEVFDRPSDPRTRAFLASPTKE